QPHKAQKTPSGRSKAKHHAKAKEKGRSPVLREDVDLKSLAVTQCSDGKSEKKDISKKNSSKNIRITEGSNENIKSRKNQKLEGSDEFAKSKKNRTLQGSDENVKSKNCQKLEGSNEFAKSKKNRTLQGSDENVKSKNCQKLEGSNEFAKSKKNRNLEGSDEKVKRTSSKSTRKKEKDGTKVSIELHP
ncbi:hypothetical protein OSTOST_09245, partial [Ostertagia ostertagi]